MVLDVTEVNMADVSNVKSACLQIIPEMFSFFLLVELYDVTEGGYGYCQSEKPRHLLFTRDSQSEQSHKRQRQRVNRGAAEAPV